ncbi:velvet complex subunit 2-like, partial [Ananas comosus]|uniref:Velvet complex subunit 2-like n=1 Tax=Ananas comosus TaxID=4615 RepID=A0A6P5EFH3_ANACO
PPLRLFICYAFSQPPLPPPPLSPNHPSPPLLARPPHLPPLPPPSPLRRSRALLSSLRHYPLRIAVDHDHGHYLQEEPGPHGGPGPEKQEALPPWISRWTPRLGWRSRASSRSKAGMEIERFKLKWNGIRVSCTRFHNAITNDYGQDKRASLAGVLCKSLSPNWVGEL